jgi:multiple sugar transport system permease protein
VQTSTARTRDDGRWWRFLAVLLTTGVVLLPLAGILAPIFGANPATGALPTPGDLAQQFGRFLHGPALTWFENSLGLALFAVIACVVVGAPAGYVLNRGRGRLVNGFALLVFAIQSFPAFVFLPPLFLTFAKLHLIDELGPVAVVYVALSLAVSIWMFSAYFASIPIELEEAAWLDGSSVLGAFVRVVLRNSLPAILSTAIFTFLFVWNDYLVALLFLRSDANYTLGIGLGAAGRSPVLAVLISVPPILVFALLNRYFSIGGIAGALSAR